MRTLVVGEDAGGVEAVGATLTGLNPETTPIIQEAMSRGLGEGRLENIEVVRRTFEETKRRVLLSC